MCGLNQCWWHICYHVTLPAFSSSYKNLKPLSLMLPLFNQVYLDTLLIYMCGSTWCYNPDLVRDKRLESSTAFK